MGGYGSGRPAERATIGRTWSYALSTKDLRRLLRWKGRAELRLTFDVNGDRMALRAGCDATAASSLLELRHPARREPRRPLVYQVRLTSTPMRFGGVRWWFVCPLSGRRVAKLHLPLGGTAFAARQACGLKQDVTQMSPTDRRWRKMAKIARRLGDDDPDPCLPPLKPMWLREATYERLLGAWVRAH